MRSPGSHQTRVYDAPTAQRRRPHSNSHATPARPHAARASRTATASARRCRWAGCSVSWPSSSSPGPPSRVVVFALEADVYPRLQLPRGVPATQLLQRTHCSSQPPRKPARLSPARAVRCRDPPAVLPVAGEAVRVADRILALHVGRLPAVLEVVGTVFPHEVVAEASEIDPELGQLMREQGAGVEDLTPRELPPLVGRRVGAIALFG